LADYLLRLTEAHLGFLDTSGLLALLPDILISIDWRFLLSKGNNHEIPLAICVATAIAGTIQPPPRPSSRRSRIGAGRRQKSAAPCLYRYLQILDTVPQALGLMKINWRDEW